MHVLIYFHDYPLCHCPITLLLLYLLLSYSSSPPSGGIGTGSCETCPDLYVCWFTWPLFRSESFLQAGSSLVWGHEKSEFEDDQGSQFRAWFKECGAAFKIKAAWGHPEIVRKPEDRACPRLPKTRTINTYAD